MSVFAAIDLGPHSRDLAGLPDCLNPNRSMPPGENGEHLDYLYEQGIRPTVGKYFHVGSKRKDEWIVFHCGYVEDEEASYEAVPAEGKIAFLRRSK